MNLSFSAMLPLVLIACSGRVDDQDVPDDIGSDLSAFDLAKGGRLFDKWSADPEYAGTFEADPSGTPGVADGTGGPFGDGTLAAADGAPALNDEGHDYRLKNFFGWDLRGTAGIYGPDYADKPYVLPIDLLAEPWSHAELVEWFAAGGDGLPALGDVLSADDLDDLAAFVVAMRTGELAQASEIWALSPTTSSHYTLLDGADVEAGHATFAGACAACHGDDGSLLLIDDGEYTLGSFARQKAYEGWLKVLSGHPGSVMGAQVPVDLTGPEQAAWILDVFAALCDRELYPVTGAALPDVADGDAHCGAYLR